MSELDAAHLAGLIEGEGSIFLYMRRDTVAIRLVITNTDFDLLDKIKKVTGIGANIVKPVANKLKHKKGGHWQVNAEAAESILKQIQLHLWIKTKQCALALETQGRLRNPKLKADRSWQSEYHQKMQELNRRGPAPKEQYAHA